MKNVQQIAETFYMAAWDLAERLAILPTELNAQEGEITPATVIQSFRDSAMPFLDLTGEDIPKEFHTEFDCADTTVRTTVLPALEVLMEEWDALKAGGSIGHKQQITFAEKCVYIANQIEMYVIPNVSPIEKGLMPI